jgi:DNA-binding HxlR family transcriptional regulator
MWRVTSYGHFCPAAQALEVVGERWALLIVRDLLAGDQRFSDLRRTLGRITAKQLTQRLRELEDHGIVERDSEEGRREVRYRLTERGRALAPVVDALMAWGVRHATRAPLPGEPIAPYHLVRGLTATLNAAGARLPDARTWTLRFLPEATAYSVRFDGDGWTAAAGDTGGDLELEARPEALAAFLLGGGDTPRAWPPDAVELRGDRRALGELRAVFSRSPSG